MASLSGTSSMVPPRNSASSADVWLNALALRIALRTPCRSRGDCDQPSQRQAAPGNDKLFAGLHLGQQTGQARLGLLDQDFLRARLPHF